MAVTDIDRVFFCCLYGNTQDESIIREIRRDAAYEEEMIFLEGQFWENHVLKQAPPPYLEDGKLILKSAGQHCGPADKEASVVVLEGQMAENLMRYLQLQEEKSRPEKDVKRLDKEIQRLRAILAAEMGSSCTAVCHRDGMCYTVAYTPVRKPVVDKDSLARLKLLYPDIYEQFVTVSESRRFSVKASGGAEEEA